MTQNQSLKQGIKVYQRRYACANKAGGNGCRLLVQIHMLRCNGGDVVAFDYLFMIHGRERETGVEEMGEINIDRTLGIQTR
mgnify:CR=1 FL=1|jgi:hypothetical protein